MSFVWQVFRIIVMDLVLSGDNAVVIGMAAHRLEARQRKAAILIGGGAAIALRIFLTAIAALLLKLKGLQLLGGILLNWIGWKLLKQEEAEHAGVKAAASMTGAITTILVADFIMSLDNVLAVAGASEGNLKLLIFGLIFSMAILMFMGNLVADLINKAWWLAYVGAGVIAWTGTAMIFEDPLVRQRLLIEGVRLHFISAVIAIATLGTAHWLRSRNSD